LGLDRGWGVTGVGELSAAEAALSLSLTSHRRKIE